MTRPTRALVGLLLMVMAAAALPVSVLAASPVAVDDPSAACQPPASSGGSFPIPEDWRGGTAGFEQWFYLSGDCGVLANDTDDDADPLTWSVVDAPTHGDLLKIDESSFAYRPAPDYSTIAGDQPGGDWVSDSFTYRANDGTSDSNLATMRFWIAPVNDPPTFSAGADVTVAADSGPYSAAWATAISPGPPNESAQTVHFTVVSVSDPSLFDVAPAIADDGTLSFTPAATAKGLATVTVEAVDDGGLEDYGIPSSQMPPPDDTSDQATFQIAVTGINHAPVAADDTLTVAEDAGATAVDVLAGDTDVDLDPLTITSVTDGAKGTVAITGGGTGLTYDPADDANGSDAFTYTISDGKGGSDTATVSVTITPSNDVPIAIDDTATVPEDAGPTSLDVLTGDTDVDGDPLTITAVTDGAKGVVAITGAGTGLTYDPADDANGSDAFTYTIADGNGGESTATVSVTITPSNDVPVAVDDTLTVAEDAAATSLDVLAGDTDIDGDTLTISGTTDGTKGTVAITGGGTGLTYAPDKDQNGSDTFTYTISDGNGGSDTATVSVTITPSEDAPVAADDTLTVPEDAAATSLDVLTGDTDADGDPLTITAVTDGAKGVVAITGGGSGLTYQPDKDANGSDTFTYTISDGQGGTDTGTVAVTITPSNDIPTADADSITLDEDAAATAVPVLVGDLDVDLDPLTITAKTNGAKGVVAITVGGKGLTYKPNQDQNGADTFTYTISDGHGGTATATVTVTIRPINDVPVTGGDSLTVAENAAATAVAVRANDSDADGDALTVTSKTNGTKGAVTITSGGTGVTYKPYVGFSGPDSFTYTVSDGHGGTATGTVTVTITGVNDPPSAVNDGSMSVPEGAAATALAVLANDSDPDGDSLKITKVTNGTLGTVAITGGGTGLTYDPASLKKGTDTFTYTVSDGRGGTDTATVLVTVVADTSKPVVAGLTQSLPGQTLGTIVKVRLAWTASDAGSGIASYQLQLSVDGAAYANVGPPAATAKTFDTSLRPGHLYRYRLRATDREGNTSSYLAFPDLTPNLYQESTTILTWAGTWTTSTSTSLSGGKGKFASLATGRVTLTFTGRDVSWIAKKTTASGRAQVYIDGAYQQTIDLKATTTLYRQLVFARHFADRVAHKLEIRLLGDGRVDVDAFVVLR